MSARCKNGKLGPGMPVRSTGISHHLSEQSSTIYHFHDRPRPLQPTWGLQAHHRRIFDSCSEEYTIYTRWTERRKRFNTSHVQHPFNIAPVVQYAKCIRKFKIAGTTHTPFFFDPQSACLRRYAQRRDAVINRLGNVAGNVRVPDVNLDHNDGKTVIQAKDIQNGEYRSSVIQF
jgi:hypothetical protein